MDIAFGTAAVNVMMYSHDGFGLGHLRRNTNIASRFVKEAPGSSVLMLVGCPAGAFFQLPPGVDYMKVPSIIKAGTGTWRPRTLNIGLEKTQALRALTIQKAAEVFRPDLFVVDYTPTGVSSELLPTLRLLRERDDPPKVILGLRDILDAPEVTRRLWERDGAYEAMERYYDGVFIYGCREVFDTAAEYGLEDALPGNVTYCGYLSSDEEYTAREKMREDLRLRKDKLVVVTAGGGCDGYPMMQACVEAFECLGGDCPFEAIVITGPLMRDGEREALERQADGLPVRVLRHVDSSMSYLNAADLVCTMGGYNTLLEAIGLRKRILVIPREGPSAEQRMRAQVFSRLGLVQAISGSQLSPARLADVFLENLDAGPAPAVSLGPNGLKTAAGHMIRLVRAERQETVAGSIEKLRLVS